MVYCAKCSLPPEYCSFAQKQDPEECKKWLKENHPTLFSKLYDSEIGDGEQEEAKVEKEGEEQKEEKKQKKKVKFSDPEKEGIINVYRLKRGGRKIIC